MAFVDGRALLDDAGGVRGRLLGTIADAAVDERLARRVEDAPALGEREGRVHRVGRGGPASTAGVVVVVVIAEYTCALEVGAAPRETRDGLFTNDDVLAELIVVLFDVWIATRERRDDAERDEHDGRDLPNEAVHVRGSALGVPAAHVPVLTDFLQQRGADAPSSPWFRCPAVWSWPHTDARAMRLESPGPDGQWFGNLDPPVSVP